MKLEDFFNQHNIIDLSFFNFRNAITAAYFANKDLEILKVNDNFRSFFPVLGNVTNAYFPDVLEQLGVPGAQIEGHAEPGAIIRLSLGLATTSGARHTYRQRTVADEQGGYRFVVPYSTDVQFSPDVGVNRAYLLGSPRSREKLAVREEDVLSGMVIRGPDL